MKATATVLVFGLLAAGAVTGALADTNSAAYARAKALSPHTYTAAHQPSGKPTKASSFAPSPGGSHRHVYGAPIQSPILGMQPKKPKTPPGSTSTPTASMDRAPTSTPAAPK
jgi:hypothetical protein